MPCNNIVVVGSCMIDFVSYAPRLPTAGETIHGNKFITSFGGKGANQCVASAKLGGNTTLVARVSKKNTMPNDNQIVINDRGTTENSASAVMEYGYKVIDVGDDVWGQKYIDNLNKEKVDTQFVKITENSSSGIAQIIVSDSGENQIVIVAGANDKLCLGDLEEAKNDIINAAVVVVQLEIAEEVAVKAVQLCKRISILNGAPALRKYGPDLLRSPTIFCVNETEASVFTELPVTTIQEAEVAAQKLLARGCQNVLITLGSLGALYLNGQTKKFHHSSIPTVNCVDSTGAGDSFIGALAYLLANSIEPTVEKCIDLSCFVAADSVTRLGTQISFPGPQILDKCPVLSS